MHKTFSSLARRSLNDTNNITETYFLFQLVVPRHTLDISMKYSYVPQTEAPYKLDRTSPDVDWSISEPEKVTFTFIGPN